MNIPLILHQLLRHRLSGLAAVKELRQGILDLLVARYQGLNNLDSRIKVLHVIFGQVRLTEGFYQVELLFLHRVIGGFGYSDAGTVSIDSSRVSFHSNTTGHRVTYLSFAAGC